MKYLGKIIATLHSRKFILTVGVRMVSPRPSSDYAKFREYFQKAKHIVVMTGAGCSAESGIPTFRGAGGLWRTYNAQDLASPSAFERNPSLVWEFYSHRREVATSKEPNKAHIAIAECEERLAKQGRTVVVITQNIDELHRRAGSKNVIEIHGSLYKTRCTKCGIVLRDHNSPIVPALAGKGSPDPNASDARVPIEDLPKCGECSGLLRPNVVWFGESLFSDDLEKIDNHLAKCDLYLVVGTSAIVYPAAAMRPHDSRVPTAEFNLEDTPATSRFHFHFQGPAGETLPKAIERHPTEPE